MSTVVAVVRSRVEAEMIVGTLLGHGTHANASGDDVGGIDLALQAQGVCVITSDSEADEARRILGQAHEGLSGEVHLNAFQRWIVRILGGSEMSS